MSVRLRDVLMGQLGVLRHEPTEKRIRARARRRTVVDSTRALLVWEPKRVVPTYAVPDGDIAGDVVAAPPASPMRPEGVVAMHDAPSSGTAAVYDPSHPVLGRTPPRARP